MSYRKKEKKSYLSKTLLCQEEVVEAHPLSLVRQNYSLIQFVNDVSKYLPLGSTKTGLFVTVSLSDKCPFAMSSVRAIWEEVHTWRIHAGKLAFITSLPSH